jgi:hypothetical protein
MTGSQAQGFGPIKVLACTYVLLGLGFLALLIFHALIMERVTTWLFPAVPPVMIAGAVGTLLKKKWGRTISYVFSFPLLLLISGRNVLGCIHDLLPES